MSSRQLPSATSLAPSVAINVPDSITTIDQSTGVPVTTKRTTSTSSVSSSLPPFLRSKFTPSSKLPPISNRPSCSHFDFLTLHRQRPSSKSAPIVLVGTPPPFESILQNASEPPFDLPSLLAHCTTTLTRELPEFWLSVEAFKKCTDDSHYDEEVHWITEEFIQVDGGRQINIDVGPRKRTEDRAKGCIESGIKDRTIFDEVQTDILKLMNTDVYPKFLSHITLKRNLILARREALWFRNLSKLTFREFFSFPNPVNEVDTRCHNIMTLLLVLAGVLLDAYHIKAGKWILVYVLYGFVARTLCGPRVDPQAFLVLFILSPIVTRLGLATPRFTAGPPKRFAQFCGIIFSAVGLPLMFTGHRAASYAVYGVLALCAALAGFLGLCIACEMLKWGTKRGWVPREVCEDCNVEYCVAKGPKDSVVKEVRASSSMMEV